MTLLAILLTVAFGIYLPFVIDKPIFTSSNEAFMQRYLCEDTIGSLFPVGDAFRFVLFLGALFLLFLLSTISKKKSDLAVTTVGSVAFLSYFVSDLVTVIEILNEAIDIPISEISGFGKDPIEFGINPHYLVVVIFAMLMLVLASIVGIVRFIKLQRNGQ